MLLSMYGIFFYLFSAFSSIFSSGICSLKGGLFSIRVFRGSLTLGNRLMIISDSFKASIVTISPCFIPVYFLTSLGIVTWYLLVTLETGMRFSSMRFSLRCSYKLSYAVFSCFPVI